MTSRNYERSDLRCTLASVTYSYNARFMDIVIMMSIQDKIGISSYAVKGLLLSKGIPYGDIERKCVESLKTRFTKDRKWYDAIMNPI